MGYLGLIHQVVTYHITGCIFLSFILYTSFTTHSEVFLNCEPFSSSSGYKREKTKYAKDREGMAFGKKCYL